MNWVVAASARWWRPVHLAVLRSGSAIAQVGDRADSLGFISRGVLNTRFIGIFIAIFSNITEALGIWN